MFFGVSPVGKSWAYVSKLLGSRLSSHTFSLAEGRGLGYAGGRAGRLFSIHVRYRLSICSMSFQKRCASWGTKTFLSQHVVIADHTADVEDITNGAISAVRVVVTVTIDQLRLRGDQPFFKFDSGSSLRMDKASSRRVTISFHRSWKYTGNCHRRSNDTNVGCVTIT